MRAEAREERERQIAEAAYALLAEKGFGGVSMLAVAKRAKASNETLYRWYGDKPGLFRALIDRNAARVADQLEQAITEGQGDLVALGCALLEMLLSPQAIALNRAAASDASDSLGIVLAESGRGRVFPLIAALFQQRLGAGTAPATADKSAALWVDLLVGDWQIRCATGAMARPDTAARKARAERAATLIDRLPL